MVGIVSIVVILLAVILLFKILSIPMKIISKLFINGIAGLIVLFLINMIAEWLSISMYIPVNITTVLIAGFLGLPGVIFLIIFLTI